LQAGASQRFVGQRRPQGRARALSKQAAQIGIAALGDAAQPGVTTELFWRGTTPCQVANRRPFFKSRAFPRTVRTTPADHFLCQIHTNSSNLVHDFRSRSDCWTARQSWRIDAVRFNRFE
jgi:hypothetical protein